MKKMYLSLRPGQKVFIVFASKKTGHHKTIIFESIMDKAIAELTKERKVSVLYQASPIKCVTDRSVNVEKVATFYFREANIDTGYSGYERDTTYPVFTTKERCLEWLKK